SALFCYCSATTRDLPSFPTRRSSDLGHSSSSAARIRYSLRRASARIWWACAICSSLPTRSTWLAAITTSPNSRRSSSASVSTLRSEEHTSELQSPYDLVCRLLLEKKK